MLGICLYKEFHKNRNWVYAGTWFFLEELKKQTEHIIISCQEDYNNNKKQIKSLYLGMPGWGTPRIEIDTKLNHKSAILLGDPHHPTLKLWYPQYIKKNKITHILTTSYHSGLYHFPEFKELNYIYFPWSIPDQFIVKSPTFHNQNKIHIYGAMKHSAYETRRWCCQFHFVEKHSNSGCDNKIMSDEEFYNWLSNFDSLIAAGSYDQRWSYTFPKYFEIPASGGLLFAQDVKDLSMTGLNNFNCIIFNKNNFFNKAKEYLEHPLDYMQTRLNGINLIKERHSVSKRVQEIKQLLDV